MTSSPSGEPPSSQPEPRSAIDHAPILPRGDARAQLRSWVDWYRAIITGQERGLAAFCTRAVLRVAEVPYSLAIRYRNRRYDRDPKRVTRVAVPVVSVGNLTLGGTGKTPVVEWIARWFRRHDIRVTILSRGYGAEHGARNDEALELEERLDDVPHLQNPDRVESALLAIEEFECQVLLLDDGFQHRRLARDLDIVLLDAADPFGQEHLVPRGWLRERPEGLARAQAVVLSRADAMNEQQRAQVKARVHALAPQASWSEVRHAPRHWLSASGETIELSVLAGRRVLAFCGIGNPAGFQRTLESCGCEVVNLRTFADHHAYDRADVESLDRWVAAFDEAGLAIDAVVCTHKDLVKLRVERLGGKPLRALVIGIEFLAGQDTFEQHLSNVLTLARSAGDET